MEGNILAVVFTVVICTVYSVEGYDLIELCFNGGPERTLSCDSSTRITFEKPGVSTDPCRTELYKVLLRKCFGKQSCTLDSLSAQSAYSCNGQTTCINAKVACMRGSEIHDICSQTEINDEVGVLVSPGFPSWNATEEECSVTIVTVPGSYVTISVIDGDFAGNTPIRFCEDHLNIGGSQILDDCIIALSKSLFLQITNESDVLQITIHKANVLNQGSLRLTFTVIPVDGRPTPRFSFQPVQLSDGNSSLENPKKSAGSYIIGMYVGIGAAIVNFVMAVGLRLWKCPS